MLRIFSSKRTKNIVTLGFYNVENLFDTKNDPLTLDDDFTADGKKQWTYKRYRNKLKKLSAVISQLGTEYATQPPAIVGLVEVENARVVQDLVDHSNLRKYHYGFVHYDSPDERGIDVALLYHKTSFELLNSKTFPLYVANKYGKRDYTRDILLVSGNLNGELIHILVNHWPSRREGAEKTAFKRIEAAKLVTHIVTTIHEENSSAKIVIMGDFNDDPTSISIQQHLVKENFYNPAESLFDKDKTGTLTYDGKWNLFDQIIISKNFLEKESGKYAFKHAEVFNKEWLKIYKGKLKGSPFRTYIGKWYQGGFSDHFPIYIYLKKNL